jgi:hypothetical protein
MKNKKTLKDLAHQKFKNMKQFDNHPFPQTRRDFIKLGLLAGGGLLMPAAFPYNAFAADAAKKRIPFLVIDCAGGAALAGNFLTGMKGGPEDLADNTLNGWDPRLSGALDKSFGIPMSALESQILKGIKDSLPENLKGADQKNFKMTTHLHFSLDDQPTNKISALTYVSKAGLVGSLLKNGLGSQASLSGGNSNVVLEESKYKPKIITSLNDVLGLTSIGDGFENLSPKAKETLLASMAQSTDTTTAEAYNQLKMYGKKHEAGNPNNDEVLSRMYNLGNQEELVQAAIVLNVIKGYTGPGVITIGDCDYHRSDARNVGNAKDLQIGQAIGRAVAYAASQNSPLFIQVITDGSLTAEGFNRVWNADTPLRSMSVMGYFNPNKEVTQRKLQIGYTASNGETDITNVISATSEKSALSTMVNYLNVIGDLASLENIYGRLQQSEIDEVLAFD